MASEKTFRKQIYLGKTKHFITAFSEQNYQCFTSNLTNKNKIKRD